MAKKNDKKKINLGEETEKESVILNEATPVIEEVVDDVEETESEKELEELVKDEERVFEEPAFIEEQAEVEAPAEIEAEKCCEEGCEKCDCKSDELKIETEGNVSLANPNPEAELEIPVVDLKVETIIVNPEVKQMKVDPSSLSKAAYREFLRTGKV